MLNIFGLVYGPFPVHNTGNFPGPTHLLKASHLSLPGRWGVAGQPPAHHGARTKKKRQRKNDLKSAPPEIRQNLGGRTPQAGHPCGCTPVPVLDPFMSQHDLHNRIREPSPGAMGTWNLEPTPNSPPPKQKCILCRIHSAPPPLRRTATSCRTNICRLGSGFPPWTFSAHR